MKNKKIMYLSQAAMIAALYVVLTLLANALGLANYAIEVRVSDALTIRPFFTPSAIPGLTIGCLLSNILIGALGTYALRRFEWLAPLPPILANTIIVPWVLRFAYDIPDAIPYLMATVGAGELISCGLIGMLLLRSLKQIRKNIFKVN